MANSLFTISQPGIDVLKAKGQQILFTTKYPFSKFNALDQTSFQTIKITFNAEPPNPTALYTPTNTLLYKFAHGYNYIPSIWAQWENTAPTSPADPIVSGDSTTTFYNLGDDTAGVYYLGYLYSSSNLDGSSAPYAYTRYNSSGTVYTSSDATVYFGVDATNVYIYLLKGLYLTVNGSAVGPTNVINTKFSVRIYVFCEPALGNS